MTSCFSTYGVSYRLFSNSNLNKAITVYPFKPVAKIINYSQWFALQISPIVCNEPKYAKYDAILGIVKTKLKQDSQKWTQPFSTYQTNGLKSDKFSREISFKNEHWICSSLKDVCLLWTLEMMMSLELKCQGITD